MFTSVEGIGVDNMIRLLSTDELVFVDKRFPLRPVFGVTHNRQWDRTLRVQSLKFGKRKHLLRYCCMDLMKSMQNHYLSSRPPGTRWSLSTTSRKARTGLHI